MKMLNLSYVSWKDLVQAAGWPTFYVSNAAHVGWETIYAGNEEYVFRSHARTGEADHDDWSTIFEPTAELVVDESEALAKVLEAVFGSRLGENRSIDGTLRTADHNLVLGQRAFKRVDSGDEIMNVDGRALGTAVNVWDGTGVGDAGASDWVVNGIGVEVPGAKHDGTNGWDTGVSSIDNTTRFTNPVGDIDINGTYEELRFWMQPKSFPNSAKLRIQWQQDDNTLVGNVLNVENYVTNMDLDVWQQVSIPISDFGLTVNVAKVRFRYRVVAGQQFWFDEIRLVPGGLGGPFEFRVSAPENTQYNVSMIVLMISGLASSWNQDTFASISALDKGLLLRHRRLSDSEVLWKFNSKDNVDLFGRYHPYDDIEFSDGTLLVSFMVKPGKASIMVTGSDVLEFIVRDDLSSVLSVRAFVHFGMEEKTT